jgi:hypothetical protein
LARKGAKYIFTVAPIFSTPLILSYGNGLCVYLQSTYTNMLSCIAALFSRTTEAQGMSCHASRGTTTGTRTRLP